jgi:O-antigen biosynthesis protein
MSLKNETLDIKKYIREPIQENLLTLYNHMGRYYMAQSRLNISEKDIVLDISCGQGYGSYLLSQKAKYVIGVDVNNDYLKKASQMFKRQNLIFSTFEYYKKLCLYYNKIVCIETIEHMKKDEIKEFLKNILKDYQGELFLTFPIGDNKPSKYNKYHLCEPSIKYIKSILNKYFNVVYAYPSKFKNNFGYIQDYCIMEAAI